MTLDRGAAPKLYEYYAKQSVRPTFANFKARSELENYASLRREVFSRVKIPWRLLAGKKVLEFGPDTGENSLVFALWDCDVTLVEPHQAAHAQISSYFQRFGLEPKLEGIAGDSVLDYTPDTQFDFVDAEGFIYTVQPTSAWIAKFHDCLVPGGLFLVTYVELYGGFMEVLQKAMYTRVARDPGFGEGVETAKALFLPKWESIPHTRRLESWFMDVITNPFVRFQYLIEPTELMREAYSGGFQLHSSWPDYTDGLRVDWIKKPVAPEDELRLATAFVEQSRLSHLVGGKCFLAQPSDRLGESLREIVALTDSLVDEPIPEVALRGAVLLKEIRTALSSGALSIAGDLLHAQKFIATAEKILTLIAAETATPLVEFARADESFIRSWGMPTHHAVFQRTHKTRL